MFIYKITNTITNKCYIGQTKRTISKRLKTHFQEALANKYDMYLHKSIRKYGIENFVIELIEECSVDNIYEREIFWIRELKTVAPNGYNQHEGGRGGCLNPSNELRKKLSDAKKDYIPWNKGKIGVQLMTDETRQKMSSIRKDYWVAKGQARIVLSRPCLNCERPFETKISKQQFCCRSCASKDKNKKRVASLTESHPQISETKLSS